MLKKGQHTNSFARRLISRTRQDMLRVGATAHLFQRVTVFIEMAKTASDLEEDPRADP